MIECGLCEKHTDRANATTVAYFKGECAFCMIERLSLSLGAAEAEISMLNKAVATLGSEKAELQLAIETHRRGEIILSNELEYVQKQRDRLMPSD